MKKRIIALLCLLVMAVSLATVGCQGKVVAYERGTPVSYASVSWRGIDDDEMWIAGFFGPRDFYAGKGYALPSLITDETYAEFAECGINTVIDFYTVESSTAEKALNLAAKHDINYILPCPSILATDTTDVNAVQIGTVEEIAAKMEELMAKYSNLSGFHLKDEPASDLFPALTEAVTKIEAARETLGVSDFHGYINGFPNTNWQQLSNYTDDSLTWQKYLNGICETGVDFLMWDMYPFGNVPGEVSAGWLNALGTMNQTAKKYNIPFYAYVQCGGYLPAFSSSSRVVNEGEMNWNVGTMLAFGAKGFGYYTLVTPAHWSTVDESYVNNDSILNKYGSKTPFFYYAKKINAQAQAMAPVLMHAAHEGIIIDNTDSPNVYTGSDLLEDYRCFKGFSGDSALIGCFDYEGTVALVVVNNSIEEHHAVVTLEFDNNYEYEVTQRAVKSSVSGKKFSLHLEAGEFALVVVK